MLNTIKKILQKNKNAYIIIVENEKPVFVINSFEEYEKMMGQGISADELDALDNILKEESDFSEEIPSGEENVLEEVNREIINLQAPENQSLQVIEETIEDLPVREEVKPEEKIDEIRIEDIPLL